MAPKRVAQRTATNERQNSGRKIAPRAPSKAATAEVFGLLRVTAATKAGGGIQGALQRVLLGGDAAQVQVARECSRLTPAAATWWRAKMAFHQKMIQTGQDSRFQLVSSMPAAEQKEAVASARAKQIVDNLRDESEAALSGPAGDSPAALKAARPAAVGTLRSWESNSAHPLTLGSGGVVVQTVATRLPRLGNACAAIPGRREAYAPAQAQQREQLAKVRSWKLRRLLEGGKVPNAFFCIEAMRGAIATWEANGGEGVPPISLLRKHSCQDVLPTMTAQFSGHIWSVADMAPFDAGQCAAALETPRLADPLHKAVQQGIISESEVRQLAGQATHLGVVRISWLHGERRMTDRLKAALRNCQVALLGAGCHFTGYQLLSVLGGGQIAWVVEGCPKASAAAALIDAAMGQSPRRFERLEDAELGNKQLRVEVEVFTGPCAEVSRRGTGEYLDSWLRALLRWLLGITVRRPLVIWFETAEGAWDQESTRERMESLMQDCGAYEFESMHVDPAEHAQGFSHRARVIYMGIRKTGRWLRSMSEEAGQEEGTAEEAVGVAVEATAERVAAAVEARYVGSTSGQPQSSGRAEEAARRQQARAMREMDEMRLAQEGGEERRKVGKRGEEVWVTREREAGAEGGVMTLYEAAGQVCSGVGEEQVSGAMRAPGRGAARKGEAARRAMMRVEAGGVEQEPEWGRKRPNLRGLCALGRLDSLEKVERARHWRESSGERGDELVPTEVSHAEWSAMFAAWGRGEGGARAAAPIQMRGASAVEVRRSDRQVERPAEWSERQLNNIQGMMGRGLSALGAHASWREGERGSVWYPAPGRGTARLWTELMDMISRRSLAVLILTGGGIARREWTGVFLSVADALPRTRIIALNMGEFGGIEETALDALEVALPATIVGHLFVELRGSVAVEKERKDRMKAILRRNAWKDGYLRQLARAEVRGLRTAQCWRNWRDTGPKSRVARALRHAREERAALRGHGAAHGAVRVLVEEGARALAEKNGEALAGQAWNGPTLGQGTLSVRGSAIGGAGRRGLFQAGGGAAKGTAVLYGGELVGKAEAERRKAAGVGGHIVTLDYAGDRLDGRWVAEMFRPAEVGEACELLDERGKHLGLAALANQSSQPNAALVWKHLERSQSGPRWVCLMATRWIGDGEEWTTRYGSNTPMEAERTRADLESEGAVDVGGEELVGRRVQVWFAGEGVWFAGKVTAFSRWRGHWIKYDEVEGQDSMAEWTDLGATEWRLEVGQAAEAGGSGRVEGAVGGAAAAGGAEAEVSASESGESATADMEIQASRAVVAGMLRVAVEKVDVWQERDGAWWAEAGWSAEEVRREAEWVAEVTRLGTWAVGSQDAQMGVWVTLVKEEGEWQMHTVAAQSAGLRSVGRRGMGLYMACDRWRAGDEFCVGRLEGEELARAEKGSADAADLENRGRGEFCFIAKEGRWVVLRDGGSGREGGPKRANDARDIPGAAYSATLLPDGELCLMIRSRLWCLDGRATSVADLMRSEIFWSYGEAYWRHHKSGAALSSKAAGKRKMGQ